MSQTKIHILHLEDDPTDVELQNELLKTEGFIIDSLKVDTRQGFIAALQADRFDIILADNSIPGFDGLSALKVAREKAPTIPFIFVSGTLGEEVAIESLKNGATDYVVKQRLSRLAPVIRRALHDVDDAHERAHIEEARRKSERDYQHLFESANDVILIFEPEKEIILEANPAACNTYGYERSELVGMSLKKLTKDLLAGEAKIAEFLKTGAFQDYESVHLNKKGKEIYFLINSSVIEYQGRQVVLSINRDITERKQAEEALRADEAELRSLFAAMQDVVIIFDREGRYLSVAPTNTSLLYKPSADMLGKTLHEILPHAQADTLLHGIQHALDTQQTVTLDYNLNIGGQEYWFAGALSPMDNEKVILVAHDISDRKQTEQKLKLFRTLIDRSSDAIEVLDPETLRFIDMNEKACQDLGYSREELLSLTVHDIDPDLYGQKQDEISETMQKNGSALFESRHKRKDGSVFPVEVNTKRVQLDQLYSVNVVRDITERKLAENALRQREASFRYLFANNPHPMWVYDVETLAFLEVNETAVAKYGYSRHEFLQMRITDIRPAEDVSRLLAHVEAKRPEIQFSGEWRHRLKDGSVIDVEIISHRMEFAARKAALVVAHDITEHKRAEEAIRKSERVLLEAESLGHTGSWEQDLVTGEIFNTKENLRLFFGDNPGNKGGPFEDYSQAVHPADREYVMRRHVQLLEGGPGDIEYRVVWPDGSIHWVFGRATVTRDTLGRAIRVSGTNVDITERKRAEEKIHQQVERLMALSAIDKAISSSFDLQISLSVLILYATRQLNADAMDVLLLNPNLIQLEYFIGRGFHTVAIEKTNLRLDEGLAGRAVLTRQMVTIPDLPNADLTFPREKSLEAEKFITYFGVPLIVKGKIKGVLEVFQRTPLDPDQEWLDFLNTLAGQAAIAIDNFQLFNGLQKANADLALAYDTTITGWSRALDLRDKETEGHTQRVTEITMRLARMAGMSEAELAHVRRGALLHDIGKMGVPDGILLKPAPLTEEEWTIMRRHPNYAYDLLVPIEYLQPALDIPYCHHERWDGAGYPRGLKGEQIPLSARLFAVADVWDALSFDRPYRKAWPQEKVLEYIRSLSGTYFDPFAVELFFALQDESK
jgi:PAS domain S-box-containing protein